MKNRKNSVKNRKVDPNDPYDAETIRLTNNFENWVLLTDPSFLDTDEFIRTTRALAIKGEYPNDANKTLDEPDNRSTSYTNEAIQYSYYPTILKSYNRATAVDFDPIQKQAILEQEQFLRRILAHNQRRMVLPLYRGNPRHWMPIDDELYGKGK